MNLQLPGSVRTGRLAASLAASMLLVAALLPTSALAVTDGATKLVIVANSLGAGNATAGVSFTLTVAAQDNANVVEDRLHRSGHDLVERHAGDLRPKQPLYVSRRRQRQQGLHGDAEDRGIANDHVLVGRTRLRGRDDYRRSGRSQHPCLHAAAQHLAERRCVPHSAQSCRPGCIRQHDRRRQHVEGDACDRGADTRWPRHPRWLHRRRDRECGRGQLRRLLSQRDRRRLQAHGDRYDGRRRGHPYTAATSAFFDVPDNLGWETQPSASSQGGIAFASQPKVTVRVGTSNFTTNKADNDGTTTVTLAIRSGTGAAGAVLTCDRQHDEDDSRLRPVQAGGRIDKAGTWITTVYQRSGRDFRTGVRRERAVQQRTFSIVGGTRRTT